MKIKTRLTITAIIMVVVPLILTCASFITLGMFRFRNIYEKMGPRPRPVWKLNEAMRQILPVGFFKEFIEGRKRNRAFHC